MSTAIEAPRVVRRSAGRVGVHAPGWTGQMPDEVEAGLRRVPGVRRVRASPTTHKILIEFDDSDRELSELLACRTATAPTSAAVSG
jgi:hypothetical protein